MDGGAPSRSPRRDTEGPGRRRLVESARDLVLERLGDGMPVEVVLSHLTPAAVAERAGVSRGLIYHYWPVEDDSGTFPFAEMLTEVVELIYDRTDDAQALAASASEIPDDYGSLLRAFTDFELEQMTGEANRGRWRARLLLKLCGVWPSSATDLHEQLDAIHLLLMEQYGLQMRAPLTVRDLTHTLIAMNDGMGIEALVAPGAIGSRRRWTSATSFADAAEDGWTLFAIAIDAIWAAYTEPITPG